jgi:hypothetical protein
MFMMDKAAEEKLENRIAHHEARAERLRTFKAWLADDPSLIRELIDILMDPAVRVVRKRSGVSQCKKIIAYFETNGNALQTVQQIADGTGLTKNSVNFVLYTSKHKDLFAAESLGPKTKLWRLRPIQ